MSSLPPGIPGRLPVLPLPPVVRPAPPIAPVLPVAPADERTAADVTHAHRGPPGPPAAGRDAPRSPPQPWLPVTAFQADAAEPLPAPPSAAIARPLVTATPQPLRLPGADLPALPPERLAAQLRTAVAQSGVFYESHLADWVEGRIPLEDVKREVASAPAMPARAASAEPDAVQRQQIDYLRHGEIAWTLPPPWREDTRLWMRDESPEGEPDPASPARMGIDLDIPGRGRVRVSLRLAGRDLWVELESDGAAPVSPADLLALGHRLGAMPGVRLAGLRTEAPAGPRHASSPWSATEFVP